MVMQAMPHNSQRDSGFLLPNISAKFEMGHPKRGHQMQVV